MRIGEIWKYKEDNLASKYWAKELSQLIQDMLEENDEWAKDVRVRIVGFDDKSVSYITISSDTDNQVIDEKMEYFLDAFEKDWKMN